MAEAAPGQEVDGVAAYLSYDSARLQVIDATGQPSTTVEGNPALSFTVESGKASERTDRFLGSGY